MAVERIVIKCNTCQSKTLLRIQIGYIEKIPLAVGCIACGIELKGLYEIDNEAITTKLTLANAEVVAPSDNFQEDNEIECSGEYPTKKYTVGIGIPRMSPFMNAASIMEHDELLQFNGRVKAFQEQWEVNGSKIQDLFNLYKNEKYDLMANILWDITGKEIVKNNANIVAMYYGVLVPTMSILLFPKDEQTRLIKKMDKVFLACKSSCSLSDFQGMIGELNLIYRLNTLIKSGVELLYTFMARFQSFTPAICVHYAGGKSSQFFENDEYGLTSFNFLDNKQFL